jgi:hypothetical protein
LIVRLRALIINSQNQMQNHPPWVDWSLVDDDFGDVDAVVDVDIAVADTAVVEASLLVENDCECVAT